MKIYRLLFLLFACPFFIGNAQTVTISNMSDYDIVDYVAEIPLNKLKISIGSYVVVSNDGTIVPLEVVTDLKGNGSAVFPIAKLEANSTETFKFEKAQPTNTLKGLMRIGS